MPTIVISRLFKGQRARHNPDKIHSYVYSAIGRLANESIELVRWQSTSRLSASVQPESTLDLTHQQSITHNLRFVLRTLLPEYEDYQVLTQVWT